MQTTLLIDGQHVQGKDHALPVADPASGCDVPEFVLDFRLFYGFGALALYVII